MIDVCFDILSNELDLTNMREMLSEMEESPNVFIESLMDRLKDEIKAKEESLLNQGLCPKCENELNSTYDYEYHEFWGHRQLCRVPSDRVCIYCDWKENE